MRNGMIKIVGWIFLLVLFSGVRMGYAGALKGDEDSLSPSAWDVKISELNRIRKDYRSRKNRLEKESDTLAEKIIKEKRKSGGEGSRKLDALLGKSQQLVADLESVSRQIADIEEHLTRNYAEAISSLVIQLERGLKDKKKNEYMKQLVTYIAASESLEKPIQYEIPEVDLEIHAQDTPIKIRQKADFLSDRTTLLKAKIYQIDARIAKLEQERMLREKIKRFADEISFFDDSHFIEERKVSKNEVDPQKDQQDIPGVHNDGSPDEGGDEEQAPPPIFGESVPLTLGENSTIVSPSLSLKEVSDFSPSDSIFSGNNIDNQISHLKQQKGQLRNHLLHLWKKTKRFYEQADERDSTAQ